MKLQKMLLLSAVIFFLTTSALETRAQTTQIGKVYEDMSRPEWCQLRNAELGTP